ncbi:hypothetical protein SASPL_156197 [Salvia splendens]|uniref:Protein FAR1-RELATED SEQUENCE n=1 Tax=Salvia splendens TaxID=180675 RepID=A0A8X8VX96_SALSN|nr:hypothetical protein SASPL_156197 [Salvia splendens]
MDAELVGTKEVNMGHHGELSYDGDADSNISGDMDASGHLLVEDGIFSEPYVGMEFDSENAAKMFYEDYARTLGFNARVSYDRSTSTEFLCSRNGLKKSAGESCGAMLRVEQRGENIWIVSKFVKDHSHAFVSRSKLRCLKPRRHFAATTNSAAKTFHGVDIVPSGVMYVSVDGNGNSSDINYVAKNISASGLNHPVKKDAGRESWILLCYTLDEENRMANAFWADSRSRRAYSHFGDAVVLDTTYRMNQFRVPFAPFTGLNHHGMDRAAQAAVTQFFPETRHCINKWDVLREGHDRMAHVCHAHPNFQVELYNCINMTETIEEFESFWLSILDKYDLNRNDWLQSIYNSRKQWVPVYCRNSFFAAISPSPGFQSSFFDGYVNQQTTLPMFFRQYERALENSFEREVEADFDTVAKFEDVTKVYFVKLNIVEMKANCSCKMFEYSGILCRHVLTVFTVTNVLTLPSHYILKRWTRNAKSIIVADEQCDLQGSLMTRYNNLCKEAIRFAEEGAISLETYRASLLSLREGGIKVAGVKKNVAKAAPSSSQVGGVTNDDCRTSTANLEMTPLLWSRQDDIFRHFNLNDTGVPTHSDLSVPRMAPASLNRDGGHSENMMILPCLKSMTWVMENKNSTPANKVAVINLKAILVFFMALNNFTRLRQDSSRESEVKFTLSRVTLEPTLRSMAYISEQLSTANKVLSSI